MTKTQPPPFKKLRKLHNKDVRGGCFLLTLVLAASLAIVAYIFH